MKYTTRSDFPNSLPLEKTFYCWYCHTPGAKQKGVKQVRFTCQACGRIAERVLIYDPNMQMYFDDRGLLIHESCGIFITQPDGKILLFKRRKFPYLLTIPAGHLDVGEQPSHGAAREAEEEIGVLPSTLTKVFEGNIKGDSCLGGADIHHWHAYTYMADDSLKVKLDNEGIFWRWYTLEELSQENTVQPVLYLLKQPNVSSILTSSAS